MKIDTPTIFVFLILSSWLMVLVLWAAYAGKFRDGVGPWILALLFISLGNMLILARGAILDILSIVLASTLLALGNSLAYAAVCSFISRPVNLWIFLGPPLVVLTAFLIFLGNQAARVLILGLVNGIQDLVVIYIVVRDPGFRDYRMRRLLLAGFSSAMAMYLGRALAVLWMPDFFPTVFVENKIQSLTLSFGFLSIILISFGFVLLSRERTDLEGRRIEEAFQESIQRYMAFIEISSEGIFRLEIKEPFSTDLPVEEQIEHLYQFGTIVESNAVMARLHGFFEPKDILGQPLGSLLPRLSPLNLDFLGVFIRSGHRLIDRESRELYKGVDVRHFQNSLIGIVEQGLLRRIWGIKRDITESKRTQELLEARNEGLKAFIYTVSHDLKAPLRGIAGYAEELAKRHRSGLSERAQFCINQILTATRNQEALIEDLLHYSRLDQEKPVSTEINLQTVIQAILQDRSRQILEQDAQVSVAFPAGRVQGWERGLTQILANLIDNALKFSRQAQPPVIHVSGKDLGEVYRFTVSDNGIGFDMKYHDRIFGLFNRLGRQEEFEGTGAGLAIVKKMVDMLGGRIWAESQPGAGATFTVEFPKGLEGERNHA